MKFVFYEQAGEGSFELKDELFKYLFRTRRHKEGELLFFRNPSEPSTLYSYKVASISSRQALLELVCSETLEVVASRSLHLLWCIIDPKEIERVFPALCEMGVSKISFIYCERSQRSYKLDMPRLRRLEISAMQQCGRSSFMDLEVLGSLDEAFGLYDEVVAFDFDGKSVPDLSDLKRVLVGCEGGFSSKERELFSKIVSFDTPLILRSQSAVLAVVSKVLL